MLIINCGQTSYFFLFIIIINYFFISVIKTHLKEKFFEGENVTDVDDGNGTNIRELYYLQQRVC